MSDCIHETTRKECWRVIFLDFDGDNLEKCVEGLVGKVVLCVECLQNFRITDQWLHKQNPLIR